PYIEDLTPLARERGYHQPDPRRAATYMEAAGYRRDSRGFWARDGRRWSAEIHGAPALEALGPVIAEQLRRGGFDATWQKRPDATSRVGAGCRGEARGVWGRGWRRWRGEIQGAPALAALGPVIAERLRRGGFDATWQKRRDVSQYVYTARADMVLWGHGGWIY